MMTGGTTYPESCGRDVAHLRLYVRQIGLYDILERGVDIAFGKCHDVAVVGYSNLRATNNSSIHRLISFGSIAEVV